MVAAALLGAAPAHAKRPAPEPFFPVPLHQRELKNGLRVVVAPMSGSGLASVRITVRTGSRDEVEPGRTGFAHFFEHMMFRGTKKMPQEERERVVTAMGASTNAYTSDDLTTYIFDVAAADLEQVMQLESDRFMNLHYSEEQFQTEAGAVYGEYRKNRALPQFQLFEALNARAFTRHTYGHTTMGYEKDIAAMPRMFDYSRRFFARHYRPENTFLVVAGDVQPEAVFALAERYFAPWRRGHVPPRVPREPEQKGERRVEVQYEGRTLPMVTFAYKSPAYDPDSVAWISSQVLAELAFGRTSPAYRRLVLEERSAQRIDVWPGLSRDPGLFTITATVADPAKVDAVTTALEEAVADARARAADPARVADAVSAIRYGLLLALDRPAAVAERLVRAAALTGDAAAIERHVATLARVTPETVRAAAVQILDAKRRTVAVLKEKGQ
jgi:zinc protease